jgi:spermidine synthase
VLVVDGDNQAATAPLSMLHLKLLGSLPALLHPNPETGLVIGLGAGITAGTLARHSKVRDLTIVELSEVMPSASNYFKKWNYDPLSLPKVTFKKNDGRHYLSVTDKKYDVITTDPLDANDAGVTNLYSEEFYNLVYQRLNSGGIAAQCITPQFAEEDYYMLVKSFQNVFKDTTIWFADYTTVIIGVKDGELNYQTIKENINESSVGYSLKISGISKASVIASLLLASSRQVEKLVANAKINSDIFPRIEYSGPRNRGSFHWQRSILPKLLKNYNNAHIDTFKDWNNVAKVTEKNTLLATKQLLNYFQKESFPIVEDSEINFINSTETKDLFALYQKR